MADYDPEDEEQGALPPNFDPGLADIVQGTDSAPGVQEGAIVLNDYLQKRNLAEANAAAGRNFLADMQSFGGGMQSFVASDPSIPAVQAATRATDHVVQGVIGTMPGELDPEHADSIANGLKGEIVMAAINSAAVQNPDYARRLLEHPELSQHLPEGAADTLSSYIDMQSRAAALDSHVQDRVRAQAADTQAQHAMFTYAANLFNPQTESIVFPEHWNQTVLADRSVSPADTATLRRLYGTLAVTGGATESDPFLTTGLVRQIAQDGDNPPVRDILGHAADGNLRMKDALHLASLASDASPEGRDHAQGLYGLLDAGRTAIMGDDPVAGARAYGRYVNWLVPNYQRTGSLGANPDDPSFLLRGGIGRFMPTAEDLVPAAPSGNRRPLREIFGGK